MGFGSPFASINRRFVLHYPSIVDERHCKPTAEVMNGRDLCHLLWQPHKIAKPQECVDFGDGQKEAKNSDWPTVCNPGFFD